MIIKITYNEPPLLVEAEIDGDRDDIADSTDFFMARIAAMKKALIKEAISGASRGLDRITYRVEDFRHKPVED